MRVCILDRLVLLYDLCGSLLADPRHSRYIIGSISHQCLYIDKFFRGDAVMFLNICGIVILDLCPPLLCLRDPDLHMFRRQLKRIPVSGYYGYIHSLFFAQMGDRTEQVIRLQTFFLDDLDIHRPQYFFDHGHLLS